MKKWNLFSVLCILAICISACDNGNEPNEDKNERIDLSAINVSVVDGENFDIDCVHFINDENSELLVEAEYKNGGFSFELPKEISDEKLTPLTEYFSAFVNDESVKICLTRFSAYKSGEMIGRFDYTNTTVREELGSIVGRINLYYMYSNKESRIERRNDNGSWNLNQGWNILCEEQTQNGYDYYTITNISDEFKWYYRTNSWE